MTSAVSFARLLAATERLASAVSEAPGTNDPSRPVRRRLGASLPFSSSSPPSSPPSPSRRLPVFVRELQTRLAALESAADADAGVELTDEQISEYTRRVSALVAHAEAAGRKEAEAEAVARAAGGEGLRGEGDGLSGEGRVSGDGLSGEGRVHGDGLSADGRVSGGDGTSSRQGPIPTDRPPDDPDASPRPRHRGRAPASRTAAPGPTSNAAAKRRTEAVEDEAEKKERLLGELETMAATLKNEVWRMEGGGGCKEEGAKVS